MDLRADSSSGMRQTAAFRDMWRGLLQWKLAFTLAWLDVKLRYRGSILGPFWLTLSTIVMVVAMGVLYAELFQMDLQNYMPFLALSLVLWNAMSAVVGDACACFTSAEGTIRSIRMPFSIYAGRTVIRNVIILGHNIVVVVGVFAFFNVWPGLIATQSLLGLCFWLVDAVAACLLLGPFCARFRDIGPIVASIMQIAFFLTPIIWQTKLIGDNAVWLKLNPFYTLLVVVREPLLNEHPGIYNWICLCAWSLALWAAAWLLFARTRGRLAFWV